MSLPRVAAPVLAAAVDGLPNRLRKKLDDTVAAAANWPVTVQSGQSTVAADAATTVTDAANAATTVTVAVDAATTVTVAVDAATTVTVAVDAATTVILVAPDGVVSSPEQATCTCLLAPNCLHRAAVLARAPVDESPVAEGPAAESAGEPAPAAEFEDLTPEQCGAAEHLWQAGVAVLAAGVSGSGVVLRTALQRATHEARVHGLHRAAAAGRNVATQLTAARERQPEYRLGDLTDDLLELLLLSRKLRAPGPASPELVGTARRRYDVRGSLRLYGLCSVPVVAESGYGGVVTYLVDREGRMWTVADLMPGGQERAAAAGEATVALGEASLSHRALGRGGLVVSGATASDVGALGAGKAVKAVRAQGVAWTEEPLAGLWAAPLEEQVPRAFAALALPVADRAAGSDLLFLSGHLHGWAGDGVRMVLGDGTILTLTVPSDHAALPYRDNLRRLAGVAGLAVTVVGRPDPARRQTVHPLALSTVDLALPGSWAGHVDLGFDRLLGKHFPEDAAEPEAAPGAEPKRAAAPLGDLALHLVRRHAERVVAGGRAVQALASPDDARLRAARLDTGAGLVRALTTAAQARPRDPFGRPVEADIDGFAEAWLAVAVYEQAASWALNEASWRTAV